MGEFDLLSAVQPADGWYAVVGIRGDRRQQEIVETRAEFDEWVEHFNRIKYNVFFGVAKYKDDSSRTKQNVRALKALWLDIDCGEGKDYPTQVEGLSALKQFCKVVDLPKPTLVNSGRGLHVYWALDREIHRAEWEVTADRLKEVCAAQGLRVDNSCFEAARILRVPGTFNHKGEDPLPVAVLQAGHPVIYDEMKQLLGVKQSPAPELGSNRMSAMGQMLRSSMESSFSKIMARGGDGCAQLNSCYAERATLTEPRWFDALSIAKFCKDRDKAVHKLSEDYPDYDPGRTEQKLGHIVGPHTCAQFEKHNPGGCADCPHLGKIRSPIILGRQVIAAKPEENVLTEVSESGSFISYHIPEYPFPYLRGKNGGIWRKAIGEEAEDTLVYSNDLYVVKRMEDPQNGGVVLLRLHLPKDGVKEFSMSNREVMDGMELRKELAARGVMCAKKQFDLIVDYIIKSVENLQHERTAEMMRNQFGWADADRKFIVGDREIGVDGTFHSPPSSITKPVADHLTVTGTLDKWKEVFDLYGRPGLEAHAFAAATAFGAPLLKFSGQRGAVINVIHPRSGTGKTTILHMCNSVWGDPVGLCAKKDDTFNSKVFKLGVFCNLPISFDEMTNTDPKQLSELTYLITQGTGKDRMKASANELRVNLTTWQTIALCSSNSSFYEKLEALKDAPEGETMRIIEFQLDYSDAIDMETGKQMFDHQLLSNYGHAGEIYARYIVENYDEVRALYATVQNRLDSRLKLTQRERFWSATVAANITGIYIAIRLGLCDWDVARIFKWACRLLMGLRKTAVIPTANDEQTLGEFLLGRINNTLIIKDELDRRSGLLEKPPLEPKQELMVRYEIDTKRIYVTATSFRSYCAQRSIGFRALVDRMKSSGMYLGSGVKRMSKGTQMNTPGVQTLIFDANHPDFSPLTGYAQELMDSNKEAETTEG